MITKKEREARTISKNSTVIILASWKVQWRIIRLFFDDNNIHYNYNSMRQTYYQTTYGKKKYYKPEHIQKNIINKIHPSILEELKFEVWKVILNNLELLGRPNHPHLNIQ